MQDVGSHCGGYEEFYLLGLQRPVVRSKSSDVSEEHVASIFRVEEQAELEACVNVCENCRRHAPPKLRLNFRQNS
jgi:hypothetical protein